MTDIKCDGKEGPWRLTLGGGTTGTITFTIPRGGTSGEGIAKYEAGSGDAGARWNTSGLVTFVEGEPPILQFSEFSGTVTIRVPGFSRTDPATVAPFTIPLEVGKFCN